MIHSIGVHLNLNIRYARSEMMPFLNIEAETAIELLENPHLIKELIQQERINPNEGILLTNLVEYADTQSQESEEKIISICREHFGEEAERAIERLLRFALERQSVAWVLFSRTTQFIHYEHRDALEGFQPRQADVQVVHTQQIIELPERKKF